MQILTSFGGFFACLAGMYLLYPESFWLSLALSVPAAGFLVRIFIIQHDCGHASFFRSRRAMDALGWVCSIFTYTPYSAWRRQHKGHHTIWNHLDRRQEDVDVYSTILTVAEYQALTPGGQRRYRIGRNPWVANLLRPPFVFLFGHRLTRDLPKSWRRERRDVAITNVALVALLVGLGFIFGFDAMLAVQLPVISLAAIVGIGLFSLQHRGESVAWYGRADWESATASLHGATYFRLPRVLQWFTGNIGFHHVHHLNHRIPNYRLERSHQEIASQAGQIPMLSLWAGIRALRFSLWDEQSKRMVAFRDVRRGAVGKPMSFAVALPGIEPQSARVTR
ncbi:MAG TPA: fatty acid desaturase [Kiloniellales bacterium]|nr:fatty acid desaturase [Kiloniellales bacterium]